MKRRNRPIAFLLSLVLLLVPALSGCSFVRRVEETERPATTETPATTEEPVTTEAPATTEEPATTEAPATTEEPVATEEPATTERPATTEGPATTEEPFVPTPCEPEYDEECERLIAEGQAQLNATEIVAPSRVGVAYPNRLPAPASPERANTREELIEIANYYAFYRIGSFAVALGYEATDADEEVNYLYRNSGFLPSLCAVFGILENGTLTVALKFYPETYLAVPRSTVPAAFLGGENDPPNGTDTLPGLDPVNGISVWDSEQACYALSHGYTIAPIPGSPAETLVAAARSILSGIVDDTMTPFQILYRVYVYLMSRAVYDYDGETWIANTPDKEYEPDMLAARMVSFRAEGPLIYEVGVCFGFAKASVLLLGLEGLDVRRAVAFDGRIKARSYIYYTADQPDRYWILVHSYDYIRIDGFDYLFDPTFAFNGTYQVTNRSGGSDKISVFRDFAVGMSYEKHKEAYPGYLPDPYAASEKYNPGNFDYLNQLTYDGTHPLMLSSKEDAKRFYDYLLENVFDGESECRSLTLLFDNVTYSVWKSTYLSDLNQFLKATGVPFKHNYYEISSNRTVADVMVYVAFGR